MIQDSYFEECLRLIGIVSIQHEYPFELTITVTFQGSILRKDLDLPWCKSPDCTPTPSFLPG